VARPKLLEIRCRTIEQMRMVNRLCRFVERPKLSRFRDRHVAGFLLSLRDGPTVAAV
jgi:hypothetical protein